MNAKALILIVGACLLGPATQAAGDIDFAMEMLSPQTSVMDAGFSDAVYMTAVLRPTFTFAYSSGRMLHVGWYDNREAYRQSFIMKVGVRIPSLLPGFGTFDDAMKSDLRVRISRNGVDFADCILAVEPIVSRSSVSFALDLAAVEDEIKPSKGICDIDLNQRGIQVGIPTFEHKDLLTTYVATKPYEYNFLEGHCY